MGTETISELSNHSPNLQDLTEVIGITPKRLIDKSRKSKNSAELLDRRLKALELRKAGMGLVAIGKELGINASLVRDDVNKLLQDRIEDNKENVDYALFLELERLDSFLVETWKQVIKGDLTAVDRVLKIMERRSKYLGLDAPEKRQIIGDADNPLEVRTVISLDEFRKKFPLPDDIEDLSEVVDGAVEVTTENS
jgi:hypothetical protein